MLKLLSSDAWVFDVEWVPCVETGRRVYGLSADLTDREVVEEMWKRGGATPENPRPYLKTALCQIVSVAAVVRRVGRDGRVKLDLVSSAPNEPERDIVDRFLTGIGKTKPQLVGYNSVSADLPMLLQRAVAHKLQQPGFCHRPNKPWEGVDYFAKYSDHHVDLKDLLSGYGKATPSLHEIAVSCGIPGKLDVGGADVCDLWMQGDAVSIVGYNETDVLTEYELLMRCALLTGLVSIDQYATEEQTLLALLASRAGAKHIAAYAAERERLGTGGLANAQHGDERPKTSIETIATAPAPAGV